MTARGPGRPAAAPPAPRVLDAPGEPPGTCLACGRRYGLDDMIDHAGRHMRAAPGAGKAGRSALLLLTGGGPAAGAAWVLAQVWDRCTLADLSGFIECEWLGRRVDVRAAIARTAGTALLDMTASVAGMFTKVADLELDTDTEYSVLARCVGEAPRPAAGSAASVLAESPIVPDISFEELDGRRPHAAPTTPLTPARGGEGAEPGGPPGRAPPGRSVPSPARPGGGPFYAVPRPAAPPAAPPDRGWSP